MSATSDSFTSVLLVPPKSMPCIPKPQSNQTSQVNTNEQMLSAASSQMQLRYLGPCDAAVSSLERHTSDRTCTLSIHSHRECMPSHHLMISSCACHDALGLANVSDILLNLPCHALRIGPHVVCMPKSHQNPCLMITHCPSKPVCNGGAASHHMAPWKPCVTCTLQYGCHLQCNTA